MKQLFLLAVLASFPCLAASPFTVAVLNYADLPDGIILPAVHFAGDAFRASGIEFRWSVCHVTAGAPEGCSLPLPEEGYLSMLVMPKMLFSPTPTPPSEDIAGLAMVGGPGLRAWAFYSAAKAVALKTKRSPALVLGCVLVHEIAHVLGLPHRDMGIMSGSLSPRELDDAARGFLFSIAERRTLHQAIGRLTDVNQTYAAVQSNSRH